MKLFKGRAAREINRKRNATGPLWYESYHDHLIRPDQPLAKFLGYISLNPVKRGLCRYAADWPYLLIKDEIQQF